MNLKNLQGEYYQLFVNPFGSGLVETTASYYLNGRSYSQALVDVRGLMDQAGIRKDPTVSEPEDSLVIMLDTFASLVEEEKTGDGQKVRSLQARLLEEFLEPFTKKFTTALEENEHAKFYSLCCRVLDGYLDLEKGLVATV